jgi:hypothetical protein
MRTHKPLLSPDSYVVALKPGISVSSFLNSNVFLNRQESSFKEISTFDFSSFSVFFLIADEELVADLRSSPDGRHC